MSRFCAVALSFLTFALPVAGAKSVKSPNGKLNAETKGTTLVVSYQHQPVLEVVDACPDAMPLTYVRDVKADYRMLSGKRSHCVNEAREYRCGPLQLRLYNDGIAFRYEGPSLPAAYRIPEGTRRWMQQWCDSYEGFYPLDTTYKVKPVPSYSGISKSAEGWNNRWGYPALMELRSKSEELRIKRKEVRDTTGIFVLLTEAGIQKGQSASYLMNDGELYRITPAARQFPLTLEGAEGQASVGDVSPWRVAIIGRLADVVESTLVTDVSEPSQIADASWIQPGVVSWIYWAYNHGSNDYEIIKKYVDMAVSLRLPYVLIDAEWDTMKDGKTIDDALDYAKSCGVKPLIWYNSSVGWVDGAPTPKFRLNTPEDREREFAWCRQRGVAGVKIDFFSGDDQRNMDYQQDLLACAARHHLLVNFHGATLPRGWQRTWPNLMSTEAVYGAEWYNNVPTFTAKAACHNATLPFTRNVVGPMDYTPCTFSDSQHPHITTHAHELALTVLFESALQHLADRPESYLAQPVEVQRFLGRLPSVWDETRLLSGYPGQSVVMARRYGRTWYVAGINGTDESRTLYLPLDFVKGKHCATLFADGDPWQITTVSKVPHQLTCKPRGGFVMELEIRN